MGVPSVTAPLVQVLLSAGIDPKTGLPLKFVEGLESELKNGVKKLLRVQDLQQAVRKYRWYNLPSGLTGELMERILYYRYTGMFFYVEANDTFYFLPYTLDGEIDVYGRFTGVTPVPFNGSNKDKNGKEKPWIIGLTRKPINDVLYDVQDDDVKNCCVLLCDYVKQYSQTMPPRQQLQECIINAESEMIPFMRTSLQNQTGTTAVRTNNEDEQANVNALNNQVQSAALNGRKYLATIGNLDFQTLDNPSTCTPADFMQAMESLDNFRLQCLGVDSNGLFAKKSHMLQAEQAMAGGATGFITDDGLIQRQEFCDKVNSLFGLSVYCELSENVTGDVDMNGVVADEQDQSGVPGEQPNMAGGVN